MKKEVAKAIKNMGEKVSVTAARYFIEYKRYNYDTDELEFFSDIVTSRNTTMDVVDLAERLNIPVKSIRNVNVTIGKVYLSLDSMMKNGIFVQDENDENEDENEG